MTSSTNTPAQVLLHGAWTMTQAAERLELLTAELARQLAAQPRPARAMIDLTAVSELDACGCQLLAVFLENLKQHDIVPSPCGSTPEIETTIRLLGFAEALTADQAPVKEP